MIICFVLAFLFLILSLFLLNGKGAMLISGYNTMSKEERQQYDEKKMCRAVGVLGIVCTVMLCGLGIFGNLVDSGKMPEDNMLIVAAVFMAVIISAVILVSRYIDRHAKK